LESCGNLDKCISCSSIEPWVKLCNDQNKQDGCNSIQLFSNSVCHVSEFIAWFTKASMKK